MPRAPKLGDCYKQAKGGMMPMEELDCGNCVASNNETLGGFVKWLTSEDDKQRVPHAR